MSSDAARGTGEDRSSRTVDPETLAASLQALRVPDARVPLEDALGRGLDACMRVFGADGSGLVIIDEHRARPHVVAIDGPGRLLADAQIGSGEGPCVDAFVHARVVDTTDVGTDPRYPALAERLAGSGVRAVLSAPVQLAGARLGSLNVYRAAPGAWTAGERTALAAYGSVVETILRASVDAHQTGELAAQLQYALDYRVPIERAVGYLMARDGLDSTDAFERLRSSARRHRRRIVDVAGELVAGGRLPDESG